MSTTTKPPPLAEIESYPLDVPEPAIATLKAIADITQARHLCIGGGFLRGLFMRQVLNLDPEMNDIDIFLNVSTGDLLANRHKLEAVFGHPIRFHIGQFDTERNKRGLIEFAIPDALKHHFGGVDSIQLNFGQDHPWAKVDDFVRTANLGINQIAMDINGHVLLSALFKRDMENKTITMNSNRNWTLHDWERSTKSMEKMRKDRPEFFGWRAFPIDKPYRRTSGSFWKTPALKL